MAEAFNSVKGTARKKKKDLFTMVNTPLNAVNTERLSLMSSARLNKITSNSLEKLSFISEREDDSDCDNYYLEFSKYLLRKAQNRILIKNKEEQEEKVKKCFVSLKFELEDLLEKFVNLSKEVGYLKLFIEVVKETNQKIQDGKRVLQVLEENKVESLMTALSNSLDSAINRLQLIDIDKEVIDEMFKANVWGEGSEIVECLGKIESSISKNQTEVSKIATELVEIKKLSSESAVLRERCLSVFQQISSEILQNNYKLYTNIVKRAFNQREECKNEVLALSFDCDTDCLQSGMKFLNPQLSLQISKLEGSYPVMPNSSSTPQPH